MKTVVIKRDGCQVPFDEVRIKEAVERAAGVVDRRHRPRLPLSPSGGERLHGFDGLVGSLPRGQFLVAKLRRISDLRGL